jgi:hypothetical protein
MYPEKMEQVNVDVIPCSALGEFIYAKGFFLRQDVQLARA